MDDQNNTNDAVVAPQRLARIAAVAATSRDRRRSTEYRC